MNYKVNSSLTGQVWWKGVIIAIILTVPSCQRQSLHHESDVRTINVLNENNPLQINLYDIIDSIKYIALETEKCLLNDIEYIKNDETFYFVKDSKGLFVFDMYGHFINEISHKGGGPQEYTYMNNFYLDRKNKLVCLICNPQRKILQYTYSGVYFNTIKIDKQDANIESIITNGNEELIAYYPLPNEYSQSKSEYSIFRIKNNSLVGKTLLNAKKITTQNVHYPFLHYPMALVDNQCLLISVLSNELFVCEKGEITSKYYVNLPNNEPSSSFLKKHDNLNFFELTEVLKQEKIGMGITAIESSPGYLFMSISNKSTLIWDGEKSLLVSSVYDTNLNLYSDLILSGGVSDEHLGFYPADFLCSKKELIVKSQDSTLAKLVEPLLEDDNPIVYQYYFKKNIIELLLTKYGI